MVAYLRSSPSIFLSFSFTACSSFFASPFESSNLFKSSEEIVLERCPTVTWMPLKICHVESEFLSNTSVQMQTDWDPNNINVKQMQLQRSAIKTNLLSRSCISLSFSSKLLFNNSIFSSLSLTTSFIFSFSSKDSESSSILQDQSRF